MSAGGGAAAAALKQELNTMKETVTGLERERDFYFSKLRDIELLLQQACDDNPELEKEENSLIKQVQTILYSTEVMFRYILTVNSDANQVSRRGSRYQPMMVLWMIKKPFERRAFARSTSMRSSGCGLAKE